MWKSRWGLAEGSAITIGLMLVGVMLQLSVGQVEWQMFSWPANIITLLLLIVALAAVYALRSKVYAFRFFTTGGAAVPAIAGAAALALLMGLVRQAPEGQPAGDPLGITQSLHAWPFVLTWLWMTIILGEKTILQIMHPSWRGLPSLVSHLGLFIVIACGTLGSADMQRLKMYCEQGQPEWRGLDAYNNVHELNLAIQLNRFTIDEYPPKLLIIDKDGIPLPNAKKPEMLLVDSTFAGGTLNGWQVMVKRRLDNAAPASMAGMFGKMPQGMARYVRLDSLGMRLNQGGYVAFDKTGAACALLVEARRGSEKRQGWVTCGSYMFPYQGLELTDGLTLVMPQREPERFTSYVTILTQDGENISTKVEVNHPVTVDGWKIYQLNYNTEMGRWSTLSVFELVSDPWLGVVYVGMLLLTIGALGMFFMASKRKEAQQ